MEEYRLATQVKCVYNNGMDETRREDAGLSPRRNVRIKTEWTRPREEAGFPPR